VEGGEPLRIAPNSFGFTLMLGVFAALPVLSIDLSAPTLPLLPGALGTSRFVAGLTLSLFMAGFALGQLGGGVLSDRRGRRPILLAGLAGFTLAGIACALSQTGGSLAFFRFIQGIGAGTCSVVSFAVVQDLFEGEVLRTKRSYVTVVFGAVPILAPALGSVLIGLAGWRSVHGVLVIAGGLLLALTWVGLPESRRIATEAVPPLAPLRRLRNDPTFVGIALANALSYGAIFAYIAGAPVVIVAEMGLPIAVFATVFACTAASLTAGAWISGRLSRRGVRSVDLLNPSLAVAAAVTLAMAVACLTGRAPGAVLIPLLLVVLFTRGVIAPNMQHLAIDRQRERAGAASAAVGVAQLLSGALASAVVAALLPVLGVSAVAVPMALLAGGALLVWRLKGRRELEATH
jgi:DHA1 family bicyclomycin/chloramphenicol resistance-like MFS transporter